MPDDIRIKTTVDKLAAELARRGLDPHSSVTVTIEAGELVHGQRETGAGLTGMALIAVLQASPHCDIDLEPARDRLPVRDVNL